jgi:acetoacetyl-CoA reductase
VHTTINRRVALVTGGTGAIGTAICKQLAGSGARVMATYRNPEKVRAWKEKCQADGCDIGTVQADVTNFDSCKAMVEQLERDVGPVDILVNCAGITVDTTFRKMTPEQWHAVMTTNLDSVFNVTRNVIQGMMDRGFGRVINISSINGQKGQIGQSNYSAAKAGMHGFTMALAQEVARKGVTVNTVAPGYIETEMVEKVPEEIRKKIVAEIPVGRMGKPEEVAYVVDFLASEEASWITGADFSVNGGHHMM